MCWQRLHPAHFNSQPHKEADNSIPFQTTVPQYFNSQPHKEADPDSAEQLLIATKFQFTASQGG